ncbi:nuclear transport factor 2 family protein [Nocardia sp. NPDC127526]|uniref:nuclear transport factor 2 family protein n=1 Tax=Nocardia sp. NPDC127526 TaxID=3345393 RepID=UPI00362865F3
MSESTLLKELLELEHAGWDSLCDNTGADFYAALMTDDALMILANGTVMNRATVTASLREAPPWLTYEITDQKLVHAGPNTAILVYTATAHRADHEPPFRALMSSVYVRTNNRWSLALYQQTPIPA